MKTVMLIGASRGIGLETVKQYAQLDYSVIATARDLEKAVELKQLAQTFPKVSLETLDITKENQIKTLAQTIRENIDLLLINAGVGSRERTLEDTSAEEILRLFKTNALGHFLVARAFIEHVSNSQSKQIISISSRMGSIEDNRSGGAYAYRASKAADNALMRSLAYDIKALGIHVMLFHPGWVKTDMTAGTGNLTPSESVQRLLSAVSSAREYETGTFLSHDGRVLPW